MRKLYEINKVAVDRVIAYLDFEMVQEGLTQRERDAQFIAVALALGVPNEDDSIDIDANTCDCAAAAVLDTVAERR